MAQRRRDSSPLGSSAAAMGAALVCAMMVSAALLPGLAAAQGKNAARRPPLMQTAWWCRINNHCSYDPSGISILKCSENHIGGMSSVLQYFHGRFSVDLKLPAGNAKGMITAFYLSDTTTTSNKDMNHAEIDIELFSTGNPGEAMLATNVFAENQQNLAQFKLDFDVSSDWHRYTIQWNQDFIAWIVDGKVYRVLEKAGGGPFPERPMQLRMSLWGANWGDKPVYGPQPFVAQVKNIQITGCQSWSAWPPPNKRACPYWKRTRYIWNVRPALPQNIVDTPQEGANGSGTVTASALVGQKLNGDYILNAWGVDSAANA